MSFCSTSLGVIDVIRLDNWSKSRNYLSKSEVQGPNLAYRLGFWPLVLRKSHATKAETWNKLAQIRLEVTFTSNLGDITFQDLHFEDHENTGLAGGKERLSTTQIHRYYKISRLGEPNRTLLETNLHSKSNEQLNKSFFDFYMFDWARKCWCFWLWRWTSSVEKCLFYSVLYHLSLKLEKYFFYLAR